jgi:hypothetical protein
MVNTSSRVVKNMWNVRVGTGMIRLYWKKENGYFVGVVNILTRRKIDFRAFACWSPYFWQPASMGNIQSIKRSSI